MDRHAPTLPTFTTPVRGHRFAGAPPEGRPLADAVAQRRPARLVREPANPADRHAVAVWVAAPSTGWWRIGYLERAVAIRLAPRLDAGEHFEVTIAGWVAEPQGRWERPLVRVSAAEDRLDGHEAAGRQDALDHGVVQAA